MSEYKLYIEITKELLDSVQVGDLIKCNDWTTPLRVKGVSENYFVMARKMFGGTNYSICEKKPWDGTQYNAFRCGMFHIGTDNSIFGWSGGYDFDDEANVKEYLEALESGDIELSLRSGCSLESVAIKKAEE